VVDPKTYCPYSDYLVLFHVFAPPSLEAWTTFDNNELTVTVPADASLSTDYFIIFDVTYIVTGYTNYQVGIKIVLITC
jgi:hypothetical protein